MAACAATCSRLGEGSTKLSGRVILTMTASTRNWEPRCSTDWKSMPYRRAISLEAG